MSKKMSILLIILFIGMVTVTTGVYAVTKNTSSTESGITTTSIEAREENNQSTITENTVSTDGNSKEESNSSGIGLIAAALAIGLSAIGSGIAVAVVASSAVGAISENPSLLGKTVIFAGLAEGIAIYGLIIAIMIISKV